MEIGSGRKPALMLGAKGVDVLPIQVPDFFDGFAVATTAYMASFGMEAASLEPSSDCIRKPGPALWLALSEKVTVKQNSRYNVGIGDLTSCSQRSGHQFHDIKTCRVSHSVTLSIPIHEFVTIQNALRSVPVRADNLDRPARIVSSFPHRITP